MKDAPLSASTRANRTGGPSFSLGNRLTRVAWGLAWTILARWTPPPMHAWRAAILRAFGADLGRNFRIHGSAKVWLPANLIAGDNVLIGRGADIYNQGRITIGSDSVISQKAYLCASTHDVDDVNFQLQLRPISIGQWCWVAADAFVGPGVTMADRSVVGARGALFRDAEADGIYGGNPAKLLRQRRLGELRSQPDKGKVD